MHDTTLTTTTTATNTTTWTKTWTKTTTTKNAKRSSQTPSARLKQTHKQRKNKAPLRAGIVRRFLFLLLVLLAIYFVRHLDLVVNLHKDKADDEYIWIRYIGYGYVTYVTVNLRKDKADDESYAQFWYNSLLLLLLLPSTIVCYYYCSYLVQ